MTTRKWLTLALGVGLLVPATVPAFAQRGDREERGQDDRGRDRGDGDDDEGRRDRRERRFDPTELLKRMDANANGQLEPDEISGRARGFIDRYATQAGLDPKQPLPIDKLTTAMQQRDGDENRDGQPKTESTTPMTTPPASGGSTPTTPPVASTDPAKPANPPLVPGFGVDAKITPAPGFGTPLANSNSNTKRGTSGGYSRGSSSSSSRSNSGGSSDGDKREAALKVRRYAEGLLKQYDENKNGVLERDEWKKMRGDPEKADRNDDKIVTLDELADRLANYGSDGGSSSSSSSGRDDRDRYGERGSDRSRPRSDKDTASSDKKSYRFLTPTERLPKGLPTWFTRNDANADGQVTMAEYSTSYNETTVAEFAKYDLDGDGLITPAECLQVEAAKTAKPTPRT